VNGSNPSQLVAGPAVEEFLTYNRKGALVLHTSPEGRRTRYVYSPIVGSEVTGTNAGFLQEVYEDSAYDADDI